MQGTPVVRDGLFPSRGPGSQHVRRGRPRDQKARPYEFIMEFKGLGIRSMDGRRDAHRRDGLVPSRTNADASRIRTTPAASIPAMARVVTTERRSTKVLPVAFPSELRTLNTGSRVHTAGRGGMAVVGT